MQDKKIQWHPGFVAAMNLELRKNKKDLIFEKEHNLNTRPLEIDLLVIKKNASVQIDNEIGAFFRGHNILEYKSPEDRLDIDVFYKSMAYASLYKAYGKMLDERRADDITVSILREAVPRELFQHLREYGYAPVSSSNGIYYIEGRVLFPTQIVVTKELDQGCHAWLKALSKNLGRKEIQELLDSAYRLTEEDDREMADSVLEVSLTANMQTVQKLMGDGNMYEALMEMMEPQLAQRDKAKREEWRREGLREGLQEGLQKGIRGTVEALREFGIQDSKIKDTIIKKYNLSEEKAEKYISSLTAREILKERT